MAASNQTTLLNNLCHPVKSALSAGDLEPEEIVRIVKVLIGWYQRSRSTQLALSITEHIEGLVSHDDFESLDDQTMCEYRRLAKRWDFIASQKPRWNRIGTAPFSSP